MIFCIYCSDPMGFSFLGLFTWWITLIDFLMLNQPCIPEINPIWSWYLLFLIYCSIWFDKVLFKIFASLAPSLLTPFPQICLATKYLPSVWLSPPVHILQTVSEMVTTAETFPKLREGPRKFKTKVESISDVVSPTSESNDQLLVAGLPLNRCRFPAWRAITPFKASQYLTGVFWRGKHY